MSHWKMDNQDDLDKIRLDKWLWAARFFKTRTLAADAISGGKVDVNGEHAKRAKPVQLGDRVSVRHPPFETHVIVRALSEHRGRASDAARLYEETPASRTAREALVAQLRALPRSIPEKGRPTKKDRRLLDQWRGR
jgi:ribosome-associated heat shock protein Hsp15